VYLREYFNVSPQMRLTDLCSFVGYGSIHPLRYSQLGEYNLSSFDSWKNATITLSPSNPLLTLDYGTEFGGFPFLRVCTLSGPAQIEVKYAEEFAALSNPFSDGPWTFSNGLANTFRVETFNVTSPGYLESFFVQGGQRWESLRLLTNGTVEIDQVGFRLTSAHADPRTLPGSLNTTNEVYNRIFNLGGGAVQPSCIDSGNAPSTWEITKEGALVRGQATAQSVKGLGAGNYTLDFSAKIMRGGLGWRVASAIEPNGPYFVLTSNYPEENTFVNTNRTLLPPNTLIFNSGWSIVNQSTLEVPGNQYFPINVTIEEGKWYHISTVIEEAGYRVKLDGETIAFVPLPPPNPSPQFSTPSRYEGTWGFGGFQEHITYFSNITVTAKNGTVIYRNALDSISTLVEYNVAPLNHSVCLDGAKRDRLLWIGDFYHTVRVVAQSSARWDYILGSIDMVFGYQVDQGPFKGFVPISPSLGSRRENKDANPSWQGLVDYQDLFLLGIAEYFRYTGDVAGLKPYWESIKKLATARLAFIDPVSGLVAGSPEVAAPFSFLGPANGSAVTGLMAFALDRLVPLANAFEDSEASAQYAHASDRLKTSLNQQLWNEELGTYALALSSPENFSLTGIAWAILSGAANEMQIASSIAKLEELRFAIGYRTTSSDLESANYQLAPNPSGFLLEALFKSHRDLGINSTTAITHLLDNLWGAMVNNDQYYSGASWEYVKPDGSPGIDLFTSLSHPWGAAPTYVLPEYLVGVEPVLAGYKTFSVRPMIGYLGLGEVSGKVPTPFGSIKVAWKISGKDVVVDVDVPEGTSGVLRVPSGFEIKDGSIAEGMLDLTSGRCQIALRFL
jgi:hypothetical protein